MVGPVGENPLNPDPALRGRDKSEKKQDLSETWKKHTEKAREAPELKLAEHRIVKIKKRELSVPPISIATDEISKKSGHLWECIGRKPDKIGGYIYRFKLREEYDDVTPSDQLKKRNECALDKVKLIFPATEKLGSQLAPFVNDLEMYESLNFAAITELDDNKKAELNKMLKDYRNLHPDKQFTPVYIEVKFLEPEKFEINSMADVLKIQKKIYQNNITKQLGYDTLITKEGVYIELPDRDALINRWEMLRETHPNLPMLDITSSEGVASDLDFIEAFFMHDALLSTGQEFVHDHLIHIKDTILSLLEAETIGAETNRHQKFELVQMVATSYRRILLVGSKIDDVESLSKEEKKAIKRQIEKLTAGLGSLVDDIAGSGYEYAKKRLEEGGQKAWMKRVLVATGTYNHLWRERGYKFEGDIEILWEKCSELEYEIRSKMIAEKTKRNTEPQSEDMSY